MELRQQFFLSRERLLDKLSLKERGLGDTYIYTHPELNVSESSNSIFEVILLGDIYSYQFLEASNQEILENSLFSIKSFEELLKCFDMCCGSFLILSLEKKTNTLKVFTDMGASRELFYSVEKTRSLVAASQPVAFDRLYPLKEDQCFEEKSFFESQAFKTKKVFVADTTNFQEIKRLKPNYYLDIEKLEVHRYFPLEKLHKREVSGVALSASKMISGFVRAANFRNKLAIPVSGGWESRVLLAASKEISKEVNYFVYKHSSFSERHQDIRIPQKLLKKLGLSLLVITYEKKLSYRTLEVLHRNLSFPREQNFRYLINGFQEHFPGHLMLNGNISEVARMEFDEIGIHDGKVVAVLEGYPYQKYASQLYQGWLDTNKLTFQSKGYRVADMLYWEENSPNWVGKANTETRMITDVLQPFNCRALITSMLSVPKKYRRKQTSKLYRQIIKNLWPECLEEPINPAPKKVVIGIMQTFGIYGVYRNLLMKYQLQKGRK